MIQINRMDDMSPRNRLEVMIDDGGDIVVQVLEASRAGSDYLDRFASVEFCLSGGKSRHTMQALRNLALAMQKDREECPYKTEEGTVTIDEGSIRWLAQIKSETDGKTAGVLDA